jgi:hypothetical protein
VADDLDFDAEEFSSLPLAERAKLCVKLAERAQAIAQAASLAHRPHYLLIADEWRKLAMEMENAALEEVSRN